MPRLKSNSHVTAVHRRQLDQGEQVVHGLRLAGKVHGGEQEEQSEGVAGGASGERRQNISASIPAALAAPSVSTGR